MYKGHSFEQCTKKEKGKALAYLFGGFSLILSIWIPAVSDTRYLLSLDTRVI